MKDFKAYARNDMSGWLRDLLFLTIVLAIPFLQYLGRLPLIDPDEGRYAEIPREMLERADLITPTLNYVKYFEKPPLLYWINAASISVFGQTEFAARLPSALCGLATVLATYYIARKLYNRRTALYSAIILGTTTGFVIQARIILTDMLLTFCLTMALGSFIVAAQREGRRSSAPAWYLFYLFCALAVLAKGLIGIVFPAGIIFFYLLLSRRWKLLADMRPGIGLLLFLAVAAPWFVAVSLQNPEFPRFFFIHEHFERFTSTVHGRFQPVWFFIPVLLGTMLPWSFFIPGAMSRTWRERRHGSSASGLYLFLWIAVIFLFFSNSGSKLVPYILPIFPPLAILIAHRFSDLLHVRGRELKAAAIITGICMTITGMAALAYARLPLMVTLLSERIPALAEPMRRFASHAPAISTWACMVIGAIFLIQGAGALATAGRNPRQTLALLCCTSFLLEILVPQLIMGAISETESPRKLAMQAAAIAGRDTRIVTVGPMQAVSWYTGRRVIVAGNPDELEFGSKQGNQSAWFMDYSGLFRIWSEKDRTLVFLTKHEFDRLLPLFRPFPHILGESGRTLLISNH